MAAKFANGHLRKLAAEGDDISSTAARKYVSDANFPWGYTLIDRAKALAEIRNATTIVDTIMQGRWPLSEAARGLLQVIQNRLAPFSPPPAEPPQNT